MSASMRFLRVIEGRHEGEDCKWAATMRVNSINQWEKHASGRRMHR